jgi:hypothetical protein
MLEIKFRPIPDFRAIFERKGARIVAILHGRVTQLMNQLSRRIVETKLSGQVLKVRTGVLRGSVHALPTTFQGTSIVGGVEAAAGPSFYGRFHEYGAKPHEIMAVKARALRFLRDGREVYAARVMHPGLPVRAFMAPSLAESAESIQTDLQNALDRAINE